MWQEYKVALQFLTRLPVQIKGPWQEAWLSRSAAWYPLVGLTVGGLLALVDFAAGHLFGPLTRAALTVISLLAITGGFHLDGLMDIADGLGSGRKGEALLKVMLDSRVGALGALAGIAALLTRFALIAELHNRWQALLLAPIFGRALIVLIASRYPYAPFEDAATHWRQGLTKREQAWSAGFALAAAALFGLRGLAALGAAATVTTAGAAFLARRLDGLCGDTYGTLCELGELTTLAVFAARWPR